jgi:hypothetical protein
MRGTMKTLTITFMLIFGIAATHAQSTSCPVQPTLVKDANAQISIDFTNNSAKQLQQYQFALEFFDVAGEEHFFPEVLSDNTRLRGGAHREVVWASRFSNNFLYPRARAYVVRVMFADGSTWSDNGTRSCSVTSGQE